MTENNAKNNKETCPACGYRTRYPNHPLGPECNREFEQMIKKAEEDGRKIIFSRLYYAIEKGKITLMRLKRDFAVAQRQKQERRQWYWNQAHRDIEKILQDELRDKLLYLTNGLSLEEIDISQMGIPRKEYNKRVGIRFDELWNAKDENKKLSQKVYGLRKAIESLEKFLNGSEKKNKLSKEKEKTVIV